MLIVFSLLLIVIQLIILRRNFKAEHLLQIPISILFGYFIDLTMVMLFFVNPGNYISSLAYLLAGCVILGFGVYTEVLANVGEAGILNDNTHTRYPPASVPPASECGKRRSEFPV